MSNNLYMPFHPGDYHTDTAYLRTAQEHGAYMLLLMNYWQAAAPLPDDDRKLAAIAKVTDAEWAAISPAIREFFQARDGRLYHKRVESELKKAREKSEAARNAVNNRRTNPPKNGRSSDDHQPINDRSSNQAQDQVQAQEREKLAAQQLEPAAAPLDEVTYEEAERRCAQAVGIEGLRGFKAIHELMLNGVSLDGRILPVLREKAAEVARSDDRPVSWNYFLKAIQDPSRRGIKSEKPVALEFAPVGSPAWRMLLAAGKKESYLRTIIAKHKGVDGVWFPPTDYPATFRARHMQSEFPPANGAAA